MGKTYRIGVYEFGSFRSPGKPCLVKYFKWLLEVVKGQRAGKVNCVFRPDDKGHIGSPKGTVLFGRGLARTLTPSLFTMTQRFTLMKW